MPADAQHMLEHQPRTPGRLQRLRENHVIEGIVGIVRQVGVGVSLDHRESLGHAFVHALAGQFDAASIDPPGLAEEPQQFAVATADVEDLGARRNHFGDHEQIDARPARRRAPRPPW